MPSSKPFTRRIENLIANFRGLPENPSRSRIRQIHRIDDLVDQFVRKHRIGMASSHDAIRDSWGEIVGEANRQFAHPARIEHDRCLIVAVNDPVVRQELQFNKALLMKRIRVIPGCHQIREIVFRIG
jgi:hypothetical protein